MGRRSLLDDFKRRWKSFDFDINEISYSRQRAQAVDLPDSYYDVSPALVALKGTPIVDASSVSDLKSYTMGARIGTMSYSYVTDVIGAKPAGLPDSRSPSPH